MEQFHKDEPIPWEKMKTEFITGTMTYRALADKYGVCYNTMKSRGRYERWMETRRRFQKKTLKKSLDLVGDRQAEALARVDGLADALLQKLETAIEELDYSVIQRKEKGENDTVKWEKSYEQTSPGGMVDRQGLKVLTGCLKDLKQIKAVLSEGEQREQEARIGKLLKDGKETEEITVTLQEDLLDYSK